MMKFYEKNRVWFAVCCILIYALGFGNLRSLGDDSPYVMAAMLAMCVILLAFILKNGLTEYYGLNHWGKRIRQMLYYIPLWIAASGNIWGGISVKYEGAGLIYAIVMFALVGVVEELLFRGAETVRRALPWRVGAHGLFNLPGVLSRKKQLLPEVLSCLP